MDDGGCRRRFDPADARMGSVHRPPMSTLDPLLSPMTVGYRAARNTKPHHLRGALMGRAITFGSFDPQCLIQNHFKVYSRY